MCPFVDVCKPRLREDVSMFQGITVVRDTTDSQDTPSAGALLSQVQGVGSEGCILFCSWTNMVLLFPTHTWS